MNDRHPDHSSRLDALEMRVVEQEKTIAELNDVITGQWRKIDALERRLSELREEVQTAATPRGAQEPPPPHY
jgi:SlyX protein